MMSIASEIPGFDYDIFFRSFAEQYAVTGSRQGAAIFFLTYIRWDVAV